MTTIDMKRLKADEGMILYNGAKNTYASVVDVFADKVDEWEEIEDPTPVEEAEETEAEAEG